MSTALERFIAHQAECVEHADEDAALEWECMMAEMQDEDANLRQQLADVTESMGRVEEMCAKLREVCKKMHEQVKHNCDFCDEYYCSSWDEDNECCVYDTYMRELGIEVSE